MTNIRKAKPYIEQVGLGEFRLALGRGWLHRVQFRPYAAGVVRPNQILEACRKQPIGSPEVYVVNLLHCTLQSAWGRRRRCCTRRVS